MRLCLALVALAQLPIASVPSHAAAQTAAPTAASPASQDYVYPSGSGLLFFYVRPERVSDFEAVVTRLSQVIEASADDTRRRQGGSWQAFRSREQVGGAAVFIFFFNPVVAGADYDPVKMLAESVPADTPALYDQLKAAVIRVERMSLTKLR